MPFMNIWSIYVVKCVIHMIKTLIFIVNIKKKSWIFEVKWCFTVNTVKIEWRQSITEQYISKGKWLKGGLRRNWKIYHLLTGIYNMLYCLRRHATHIRHFYQREDITVCMTITLQLFQTLDNVNADPSKFSILFFSYHLFFSILPFLSFTWIYIWHHSALRFLKPFFSYFFCGTPVILYSTRLSIHSI